MTALVDFAAVLAAREPVSGPARALVRLHVIDTLAALIAGAHTAEGRMLLRFRSAGRRPDPEADVMTLCALARLSEVDDIHLASMTTPGAIVIPGALAIAATLPACEPHALIASMLAGYEAMTRLGTALDGPGILYRGIWPTYFAAPFGIAAAASRLLGLDAAQTAHALALALTCAAPGVGRHNASTTSRWLAAGQAARNGLAAAQAAHAGFTADTNLLDSGFFPGVYAISPKPAVLTENMGARNVLADVSFKPWCAARQTMAATQALREILAGGVRPADIVAVKAAILPPHQRLIDHGITPGDRASYLTSLPYNMAVAAVAPELADALSPAPSGVPDAVTAFMQKITVETQESLLSAYPHVWPAQVTVTTADGVCTRQVTSIPGDPQQPFGEREVTEKFRRFAIPAIGEAEANALLDAIDEAPANLLQQIESAISAS
jgi:2-methylcitrate dehydratase PrpD